MPQRYQRCGRNGKQNCSYFPNNFLVSALNCVLRTAQGCRRRRFLGGYRKRHDDAHHWCCCCRALCVVCGGGGVFWHCSSCFGCCAKLSGHVLLCLWEMKLLLMCCCWCCAAADVAGKGWRWRLLWLRRSCCCAAGCRRKARPMDGVAQHAQRTRGRWFERVAPAVEETGAGSARLSVTIGGSVAASVTEAAADHVTDGFLHAAGPWEDRAKWQGAQDEKRRLCVCVEESRGRVGVGRTASARRSG